MLDIDDSVLMCDKEYKIGRCIGKGKFAEVYRVHVNGKRRALKIFKGEMGYLTLQTLISDPLRLTAKNHPNILPFCEDFDVIQVPNKQDFTNRGCCTMRFVVGAPRARALEDIREYYDSPLVPIKMIVELMKQVCSAVAVAHNQNPPIIHGDLTPRNVLLEQDDENVLRVFVSDFTLARNLGLELEFKHGGQARFFKRPPQLPPEFLNSPPSTQDDVWAIGVMLYELLTNRLPYEGLAFQGVYDSSKAMNGDPPFLKRPRLITDRVDACLDRVVVDALAWKREDRYANAREIEKELQKC